MSNKWPKVKLGDVLMPISRPVPVEPTTTYPILGAHWYASGLYTKNILPGSQIQAKNLYRVEGGDFVYNRLFGWKGSFAIASREDHNCYVSNEFPCFVVKPDRADGKYIWRYFTLPRVWDEVLNLSTGGTPTSRNRLKEEQFLAMVVPLPPLAEQQRIAARIEELAAQIEEARALRIKIKNETDVLFAKALTKPFEAYGTSMQCIGDVFTVTTGGTPSRANPAFWGGDIKWISSGEVKFTTIEDTTEKITLDGVQSSNAKVNPPGTVLLAMIGQGKTRGQCAVLNCHAATNQNVAAIHVYKTRHQPEYVFWWLYSQYQQSRAVETGTAQPALSAERVKKIPIPIAPIDGQRRIVSELSDLQITVDRLKNLQAETAAEIDALIPSILDKAFRGDL